MSKREIASLFVNIAADTTELKKGMREANSSIASLSNQMQKQADIMAKQTKAISNTIKSAFSVAVVNSAVKNYVELADTYKLVSARLDIVSKSNTDLAYSQQELFNIAQATKTALPETMELYAKLSLATQNLGKTTDQTLQVTEAINKALIISGGSAEASAAALVQLGQGFASGVLRGEELNSVMEQTPRLAIAIADGLGIGLGELRAWGAEGKLTAEAVFKALESQSAKIQAEFSKMPVTVNQATTQVKNALMLTVATMEATTKASENLAKSISDIADSLSTNLTSNAHGLGVALDSVQGSAIAVYDALGGVGVLVGESVKNIAQLSLVIGNASNSTNAVTTNMQNFSIALGMVEVGIKTVAAGVQVAVLNFENMSNLIDMVYYKAKDFFGVLDELDKANLQRAQDGNKQTQDRWLEILDDWVEASKKPSQMLKDFANQNAMAELGAFDMFNDKAYYTGITNLETYTKATNELEKQRDRLLAQNPQLESAINSEYAKIMTNLTLAFTEDKKAPVVQSPVIDTKALESQKKAYEDFIKYIDTLNNSLSSDKFDKEINSETQKYLTLIEKHQFSASQKLQIDEAFTKKVLSIEEERNKSIEKATKERLKNEQTALIEYYKIVGDTTKAGELQLLQYKESLSTSGLNPAQQEESYQAKKLELERATKMEQLSLNEQYYRAIGKHAEAELLRLEKLSLEYEKQGFMIEQINEMINGQAVAEQRQSSLFSTLGINGGVAEQLQTRLEAVDTYYKQEIERINSYYDQKEQNEQNHQNRMSELAQLEFSNRMQTASAGFGALGTLAKTFYALSDGESKSAARAYQAIAVTETIINTYLAAQKAYATASHPALGAALAAISIAQGMANVAMIKAQKFHSGGFISGNTGLMGDEVPAVLQTGEGVLSRRGMANLDKLNMGGQSSQNETSVTVVNFTGQREFESFLESRKGQKIIKNTRG